VPARGHSSAVRIDHAPKDKGRTSDRAHPIVTPVIGRHHTSAAAGDRSASLAQPPPFAGHLASSADLLGVGTVLMIARQASLSLGPGCRRMYLGPQRDLSSRRDDSRDALPKSRPGPSVHPRRDRAAPPSSPDWMASNAVRHSLESLLFGRDLGPISRCCHRSIGDRPGRCSTALLLAPNCFRQLTQY
jgi:hypothetical protein